jgi:hypothetical protein
MKKRMRGEGGEFKGISRKPVRCTGIFFFNSKGIIQRVKREFLFQNLGHYLKKKKKKIQRVNISGRNIFLLGMVWYLKRDKIEVYLYRIEYRLCMKNKISI